LFSSLKVLLVLDACFSGHVFNTQSQPHRIDDADELIQIYRSGKFASVSAMTACSEAEYAMEGGSGMSNGFFTRSIEAALNTVDRERLVLDDGTDNGTDNIGVGFVAGNELFRSIKKNVRTITKQMTPKYLRIEHEHWGQECNGDFLFCLGQKQQDGSMVTDILDGPTFAQQRGIGPGNSNNGEVNSSGAVDSGAGGSSGGGTFPSGSSVSAVRELKRAGSIEELESAAETQAETQAKAMVAPPQTLTLMQKVTKIVVELGIDPSIKAMPNKIAAANVIMGIEATGSMVQQVNELWSQLGF
jgi:hypothetical protein